MSVVGIDFGCESCKIAVVKSGGIDVLQNSISKRETASMLGFGKADRLVGDSAAAVHTMNGENTITDLRLFLGKRFSEPATQAELANVFFKAAASPKDEIVFDMQNGEQRVAFGVPNAVACMLNDQKANAERALGLKVSDCVINLPGYSTHAERLALHDAATIAQLKPLEIVNNLTAVALNWGFYRTDIGEETPVRVMFVDLGHANFEVAIVSFLKNKMEVIGYGYDRTFGGRDFTKALVDHFANEFLTKPGIDVRKSPKALLRLTQACDKLKKVLTSNPEAHLSIECLMNDRDVKGVMTRDQFEALGAQFVSRIRPPIEAALAQAGIAPSELFSVECVGGGTRVLAARGAIEAVVGRSLSDTLPKDEAVARGCALRCAMLSPVVRVRDYAVVDKAVYSIEFTAPSEAEPLAVVRAGEAIDKAKGLNFLVADRLELTARYSSPLLDGTDPVIARYVITGFPGECRGEQQKIKVKAIVDHSHVLRVPWARLQQEYEVEVEETAPPADAATASDATAGAAGAAAAAGTKIMVKKKKVREIELKVEVHERAYSQAEMTAALDVEAQMAARDNVIRSTAEAKNAVESYVYDMRAKVNAAPLREYISDADRERFCAMLEATEDWLYNDGESCKKSEYEAKLAELKVIGEPPLARLQDAEARPEAAAALRTSVVEGLAFAASTDERFSHIDAADRTVVRETCAAALAWLDATTAAQAALPKTEAAVLSVKEINRKEREMTKTIKPIMSKPKPKPAKTETPKATPPPTADAPADAAAPTQGDAPVPEPGNVD